MDTFRIGGDLEVRRLGFGAMHLSVDTREANMDADGLRDILYRNGGHSASRSKMESTTSL